ncbi:CD9 antigen-like [Danio aesculapii]|uniref:CD9 antigen-like n=1 Tax=Danio aesculapii TaxID=1142201 RepID=UPI0024BF52D8|nr:CD9 antigen-like [Danio aesculapii]
MMVVGFLGCCGAIKESSFMLGLFFVFLLIIFAAEVAAGIWGLSNQDKIVSDVQQWYTQNFNNYKQSPNGPMKETMTAIHYAMQCCGLTGLFTDGVSDTCPKQQGLEVVITTSCPSVIKEMFTSRLHVIGGVGIGIGVIMVFGMIFSMLLCCAIRRTRDIV